MDLLLEFFHCSRLISVGTLPHSALLAGEDGVIATWKNQVESAVAALPGYWSETAFMAL